MDGELLLYLKKLFGEPVVLDRLSAIEQRKAGWAVNFFTLSRCTLCGKCFLFAESKGVSRLPPAAAAKQMERIKESLGMPVMYVPAELSAHDVPRLIALHVPFIAPGKAVFLPDMGIMMEKTFCNREVVRDTFSVTAQLLAIGVILGKIKRELTLRDAVAATGFSAASAVHAFQELAHFGLCERKGGNGRVVTYVLHEPSALWELGRNRFFNPCKKEIGIDILPSDAVEAGDTALSSISDINPPAIPVFAVPMKGFRSRGLTERGKESASYRLQLWLYPPTILGDRGIDRISLALSLRDNQDDRIQIALETVMGDFRW